LSNLKLLNCKKLYFSESESLAVLVTGVGSAAVESAIAWVYEQLPKLEAWLNVGVAGHESLDLGSLRVIQSVQRSTQEGTQQSIKEVTQQKDENKTSYPHIHFRAVNGEKLQFSALLSVDQPTEHYPQNSLVDMESAAFVKSVRRLASLEAIQLIKVVSDNALYAENHHQRISASQVSELIAVHAALIVAFIHKLDETLLPHTNKQTFIEQIETLKQSMHITESQKQQLLKLLPLLTEGFDGSSLLGRNIDTYNNSKELIASLNETINNQSPRINNG